MKNRILIAEDDRDLVNVLARRCRNLGAAVDVAYDGLETGLLLFLDSDRRRKFDLVILDVEMPVADGLSLADEAFQDPQLARTPFIILTGRRDAATIRRCRNVGAHYVCKSGGVWQQLSPIISLELHLTDGVRHSAL